MKKLFLFLMSISLVAALAACGGGDDNSSEGTTDNGGGDNTVNITAKNWEFDKSEYTVPAGEVTIDFKSDEGYHGLQINGTDVNIEGEGTKTVNLDAGEYTIQCSVPCGEGHADMASKLVVE